MFSCDRKEEWADVGREDWTQEESSANSHPEQVLFQEWCSSSLILLAAPEWADTDSQMPTTHCYS